MRQADNAAAAAQGPMSSGERPDSRRAAARRTAWCLAALAFGIYLLLYFLGQLR